MELTTLKPIERTIEITNPATSGLLGIRITLMSIEDEKLQRVKREIADESLRLQARQKSMKMDQVERNGERILWAATTGWEWYNPTGAEGDAGYDERAMPTFNGEAPEYTQKNFCDLCRAVPQIAEQIREAVEDGKAFFAPSNQS